MKVIDKNFIFQSDSYGKDPDTYSPTLRKYHKILWSKLLPNGKLFNLRDDKAGAYLYHNSELGEFFLGSDTIGHSYRNQKRKQWLTRQIPEAVNEVYCAASTIGACIIFPNNRIDNKQTINGARGCNVRIDDRFDLTLECIKRFYVGLASPLHDVLFRYRNFFNLFGNFRWYVDFFLLQDLVTNNYNVKFYLPFDNFVTAPSFRGVDDYMLYKKGLIDFIRKRNERIENIHNR